MTSDQLGFTSGAIKVFRTSIRLNGRRTGLYRCSVRVRSQRRSLDHGNIEYLMFPWSNERRWLRTLTEHLYSPVRLPLSRIDVLNTLMAPLVNPSWSLVIHMKTMHAYTDPQAISPAVRAYRRFEYPRSARLADTIVINSKSLQSEINNYLDVDAAKFRLVYEAVDHDVFNPGDIGAARAEVAKYGINRPFALFVS